MSAQPQPGCSWPPIRRAPAREQLAGGRAPQRRRSVRRRSAGAARARSENLHLTLCFLGSRPVEEIAAIGRRWARAPPMWASCGGSPAVAAAGAPRSLAVAIHDEAGELAGLHAALIGRDLGGDRLGARATALQGARHGRTHTRAGGRGLQKTKQSPAAPPPARRTSRHAAASLQRRVADPLPLLAVTRGRRYEALAMCGLSPSAP